MVPEAGFTLAVPALESRPRTVVSTSFHTSRCAFVVLVWAVWVEVSPPVTVVLMLEPVPRFVVRCSRLLLETWLSQPTSPTGASTTKVRTCMAEKVMRLRFSSQSQP